jgi:hypothetical protein
MNDDVKSTPKSRSKPSPLEGPATDQHNKIGDNGRDHQDPIYRETGKEMPYRKGDDIGD